MRLLCKKCSNTLTFDLYPVKYYEKEYHGCDYVGIITDTVPDHDIEYFVKEGTIILNDVRPWIGRKHYSVSYIDCLGVKFEPYTYGYGCCDNNGTNVNCAQCNTVLGYEFSDCIDDKAVVLFADRVDRSYKT